MQCHKNTKTCLSFAYRISTKVEMIIFLIILFPWQGVIGDISPFRVTYIPQLPWMSHPEEGKRTVFNVMIDIIAEKFDLEVTISEEPNVPQTYANVSKIMGPYWF